MRLFTFPICLAAMYAASICDAQAQAWGAGVAAGQLKFSDGSTESAIGATVAAHVLGWLTLSANPTYAWAHSVAIQASPTVVIPARTVSGFTDLPLNLGISRALPGTWSPSVGFSFGVTLPTGDTASLGSGRMAVGLSASVGIALSEDVWLSAGAGRSLSNGFSAALASASSTSMAISGGTTAGRFQVSASLSGDVGAVPKGYESARSIAAGIAVPVGAGASLSLDGSVGLTNGSPTWAYTVGFGTTAAGIVAATVAPYQRLRQAFGAGTGAVNKPRTGKP